VSHKQITATLFGGSVVKYAGASQMRQATNQHFSSNRYDLQDSSARSKIHGGAMACFHSSTPKGISFKWTWRAMLQTQPGADPLTFFVRTKYGPAFAPATRGNVDQDCS